MKKSSQVILIVCVLLLMTGIFLWYYKPYKSEEKQGRKFDITEKTLIPVKNEIRINIHRYEKDLFAIDQNRMEDEILRLSQIYPDILIDTSIATDHGMILRLRSYLNDTVMKSIHAKILQTYPNLDALTKELRDACSYYLIYFPNEQVPVFYTMMPGIAPDMSSIFGYDNEIFICLDMYMGTNFDVYPKVGLPMYLIERMDKKYIAIDCFKKALVYRHLPKKQKNTLLDYMFEEGKKLYFTELMFPQREAADIIGYNPQKYAWAKEHQKDIWTYLISKNILFSKNDKDRLTYIQEAPFTKSFNHESPGRIGTFLGWQIIKNYMETHKEVSCDSLMKITDSQLVLNQSGYKPK